ncbi:hypothetical protein OEZ71_03175 [Defluviimonas sp. WL0050]|uniref:DUF1127 domain-containing protein n=1 Tax=Albidovulum litorale TaxID=2984134 RepID=A0ABT2ZJI4_9RHOB|nr:hypothetical protein [Defluviimonas sp. WL0050]MCV2871292.1 hypothetical protein [Defluviimonas sp. WL0050]
MNAHFIPVRPEDRPHVRAVAVLVHRYGVYAVILAAVNLAFRRHRYRRRYDADLSDHVRRDVGLEPPSRGRSYWEL